MLTAPSKFRELQALRDQRSRQINAEGSKTQRNVTTIKHSQESSQNFDDHKQQILETIKKSHVTLITAPTGSGKTTQVPQYLLDDAKSRNEVCNILVSVPKKIAAVTVAQRVAQERNCDIGTEVGYQIGLKKMAQSHCTRLLYCTTGVILQKLINDKSMHKYSHIILDEVHEREIDMDLLITLIKEIHIANSMNTKIVLMSATLDKEIFMSYFTYSIIVPSFINIESSIKYSITEKYLDDLDLHSSFTSTPGIGFDTYQAAVHIIKRRLHKSQNSILVFLPGIYEIEVLRTLLQDESDLKDTCLICILHSVLSTDDQQIAFRPANKPKVVLSSNIAESSVTITGPEVDCIIDFCLTKYVVAEKQTSTSLKLDWASKNSLKQRAGRTGRTCNGVVYRMILRRFFESLPAQTIPEMQRSNLETVVLRVKLLDLPPTAFLCKAISPPKREAIITAVKILKELGGLQRLTDSGSFDSCDGALTFVGGVMAALPLDVHISKLITLGYAFSVLDETIICAAGMSVKSIFRNSYQKKLDVYQRQLSWADGSGCDFIAILNAYRLWCFTKEQGNFKSWEIEKAWCERFNLERKNLHEMRQLIFEIKSRLKEFNISESIGGQAVTWAPKEKALALKICIAGAFVSNFFVCGESSEMKEIDVYKTLRAKDPLNTIIFKCKEPVEVGVVYEEQVKKMIVGAEICGSLNDVEVEFEKGSSKIFVSFSNSKCVDDENYENSTLSSTLVPGKVALEVYKAIKLRQMGVKFTLKTMERTEAEKYAVTKGLGTRVDGFFECGNNYYKCPELVVIPSTCTKQLEGIISHIDHIGKFFIQPKYAEFRIRQQMEKALKDGDILTSFKSALELKRHQRVLVYHRSHLKRAEIMDANHSSGIVTCYLYDFGEHVQLKIDAIHHVPECVKKLFDIPPRCFEASLCGVDPGFKCPRGKWTKEAINYFRQLTSGETLNVEVYSVHSDVSKVTLMKGATNINKTLIKEEFGRRHEENFPHRYNHEMRNQCQFFKTRYFSVKEEYEQQVDRSIKVEIQSPPNEYCTQQVSLHGPISPLETNVLSTLVDASCAAPKIDPLSVNSILLRDNPGNIYGRLLLSGYITSSQREVILHQTSLMPDIPGIAEILALIFAPYASLSLDENKTRYASVRFGLGASSTGQPFFFEHDSTLPINVFVDSEDIEQINKLRHSLSHLFVTLPQTDLLPLTEKDKSSLLQNIKELSLNIFSKYRRVLPPVHVSSTRKWDLTDQENCEINQHFRSGGDYCQISFPQVHPHAEAAAAAREKLDALVRDMEIAKVGATCSAKTTITCPLCERNFEDTISVIIHFDSKMHKNSLKILMEAEEEISERQ